MTIPNPGSDEAVALGCKCPRIDNGYGRGCGRVDGEGKPLFWRSSNCALHVNNSAAEHMRQTVGRA